MALVCSFVSLAISNLWAFFSAGRVSNRFLGGYSVCHPTFWSRNHIYMYIYRLCSLVRSDNWACFASVGWLSGRFSIRRATASSGIPISFPGVLGSWATFLPNLHRFSSFPICLCVSSGWSSGTFCQRFLLLADVSALFCLDQPFPCGFKLV